jgi:hypothetical protein
VSDPRSRWNELLGISNDLRDPDLYQLLGFDRVAFDAALLDERFRDRMQKIQAVRSTKHKEFIEFVKGELRRARRILANAQERADYDRELLNQRTALLRRVLAPVLATGALPPAAEQAVEDEARRLGLTDEEARLTIEEELGRSAARRGGGGRRALADVTGLSPEAAAALAAAEAAELAELAGKAAARAIEAARQAKAARTAPTEPELDPVRAPRARPTPAPVSVPATDEVVLVDDTLAESGPGPGHPDVRFCDFCGVSLPVRWKKTGEAERVGTRLLCAPCSAPIRAGVACLACSRELAPGEGIAAGGSKRLCRDCSRSSRRLKVCARCQVILPRVALERGEARARDGKLYCKECFGAEVS